MIDALEVVLICKGGYYGESVKVNKTKVNLKKGKKLSKQKVIRYESANPDIATVNASTGKVKAKKAGTAYIYAYAKNGAYRKIKVKVK